MVDNEESAAGDHDLDDWVVHVCAGYSGVLYFRDRGVDFGLFPANDVLLDGARAGY